MKEQLKREMYITAFSWEQSVRVGIQQDPEVAQAIEAMPKAVTLIETAKKLLVQRDHAAGTPAALSMLAPVYVALR